MSETPRTLDGHGTARLRGEQGSGVAYALVIGAVLLVFLVAIVDLLTKEMKWIGGTRRRAEALFAADAALDRALYVLQKGSNWDAVPIPGFNNDMVFSDTPNIRYKIRIQEGNWTPYTPALGAEADYAPANVKTERTMTILATYSPTGERRKVQGIAIKTTMNSALYTEGVLALGGSSDIYWGPVVSYETGPNAIVLTGGPGCQVPSHPIYIAKGGIRLNGKGAGPPDCPGTESDSPYAGVTVDADAVDKLGALPDPQIDLWKSIAQTTDSKYPQVNRRHYFSGQASWSFDDSTSAPWPQGMKEGECIFFDTVDGKAYSGANKTEVTFKGGSTCGFGTMVVMGDLQMKGNGGCPTTNATLPQDCPKYGGPCSPDPYPLSGHFWDGYIWVEGTLNAKGTQSIYGTAGAKGGLGSGNFAIWFKSGNQNLGVLGQSVLVKYWRERAPESWDPFP